MDMRFGTWNVRSLNRAGTLKTVGSELAKYTTFWSENLKGRDHSKDVGIDWRILEWILQRVWTGFIWPKMVTSGRHL
jgi:hypothetical protein